MWAYPILGEYSTQQVIIWLLYIYHAPDYRMAGAAFWHSTTRRGEASHVAGGTLESGKETALPLLPPLRTVHASFPAHGSSLFKAPLQEPVSQHLLCHLHDTRLQSPDVLPEDAHAEVTAFICFSSCKEDSTNSLVTRDPAEVCTVAGRDNVASRLNPYPPHYRAAFACSAILCPSSLGLPYGRLAMSGEGTGLPCSA